jgi:hypothetical protein
MHKQEAEHVVAMARGLGVSPASVSGLQPHVAIRVSHKRPEPSGEPGYTLDALPLLREFIPSILTYRNDQVITQLYIYMNMLYLSLEN